MINWIKKLFHGNEMPKDHNGLPMVTCDIPIPKLKPTKPEKDISEPVLAIVECMKKYPSRWKVKEDVFRGNGRFYTVIDIKTGLLIVQYVSNHAGYGEYHKTTIENIQLTYNEEDLLRQSLINMYSIKSFRLTSMKGLDSRRR